MTSTIVSLGAGVFLFCILVAALGPGAQKKDKIRSRLESMRQNLFRTDAMRSEELSKPFNERVLKPLLRRLTGVLGNVIPMKGSGSGSSDRQKKMLMQAGWTISLEEYNVIHLMCMLGCGLLGLGLAIYSKQTVMYTVLYAVGGLFCGYTILRYACAAAATKRRSAMERQLPDMLDLLSVSVAAGLGFDRAVHHIVNTMEGPLIDEFTVTYREMSMGRPRNEALALLAQRCGVDDLNTVTGALIQAGELGIPIRNVLQSQSAGLRRIRKNKVQEQAAKVSTKILLPMVAFIFPVLLIILLGPSLISILEAFS
ncbi:MAG: type II secretion system F family protein [Clostridia bacterium]|nr:type II secretion system F family protein [Clostridia bacterium]